MHFPIAISGHEKASSAGLALLARQTNIPLLEKNTTSDYLLYQTREHLEIRACRNDTAISVDFLAGKLQHRRLHGGGKGQNIAKAVGLNKKPSLSIIDVTAGMGSDSFVLATLGCDVTLIERTPAIHAILEDALQRVLQSDNDDVKMIINHMHLVQTNAINYLADLPTDQQPDVIYLDPMFPERKKSAQVKKEMQFFHDLVGTDDDAPELLQIAQKTAKERIVVKRPRLAPELDTKKPHFKITGKSIRYDVYLPEK